MQHILLPLLAGWPDDLPFEEEVGLPLAYLILPAWLLGKICSSKAGSDQRRPGETQLYNVGSPCAAIALRPEDQMY